MNEQRLLKLANLLEENANNPKGMRFDLTRWVYSAGKEPAVDCGTTGCAMGLAAISGIFKEDGINLYIEGTGVALYKHGYIYHGFAAAAALFDIEVFAAIKLFSQDQYKVFRGSEAELAVAARIRAFVTTDIIQSGIHP
jgi:hypothetical protein